MVAAQFVERGAEHAPVGQPGQRVLGRQPGDVGLGLAPFGLARENPLHRGEHDQRQDDSGQDVDAEIRPGTLEDFRFVAADADPQRMAAHLAEGYEAGFTGGGVDVVERHVAGRQRMTEHRCLAEILAEREAAAAAAARPDHAVRADQCDRRGGAEVDPVVEVGQVLGIERGHDDAAEAAVAIEKAPGELHRPLPADAADDRLADEQAVLRAVEMDAIVLAVAQVHRAARAADRRWRRA